MRRTLFVDTIVFRSATLGIGILAGVYACTPSISATGSPRVSAPARYQFAEVAWHAPADSVRARFERAGFVFDRVTADSDLVFSGELFDRRVAIVADMSAAGLVRTEIAFDTDASNAVPFYDQLLAALQQKYGRPLDIYDGWFRVGMHNAGGDRNTWAVRGPRQHNPDRDSIKEYERVDLSIHRGSEVDLTYSSRDWLQEERRRTTLKAAPL